MTPFELVSRKLAAQLAVSGATLPVESLLIDALEGERRTSPSSGIGLNVHVAEQPFEPLPCLRLSVRVVLVVACDDDKSGVLFRENYDAVWAALFHLASGDNCTALGDEGDELAEGAAHVFAVDGFRLTGGNDPEYEADDNGGTWICTFEATLDGRVT